MRLGENEHYLSICLVLQHANATLSAAHFAHRRLESILEDLPNLNLVRDAWREVLDLADDLQILSIDDFMDIGGHSLKLAQVRAVRWKTPPSRSLTNASFPRFASLVAAHWRHHETEPLHRRQREGPPLRYHACRHGQGRRG